MARKERMTLGEGRIRKGRGAEGRNTAGKRGTTVTAVMRGRRPKGKAGAGAGVGAGAGAGAEKGPGRAPLTPVIVGKGLRGSVDI